MKVKSMAFEVHSWRCISPTYTGATAESQKIAGVIHPCKFLGEAGNEQLSPLCWHGNNSAPRAGRQDHHIGKNSGAVGYIFCKDTLR